MGGDGEAATRVGEDAVARVGSAGGEGRQRGWAARVGRGDSADASALEEKSFSPEGCGTHGTRGAARE
jgi:hypothetical protein